MENTDQNVAFLFLGNQLALDFLNTRPVLNGKATELLRAFGPLVEWFQDAGLLTRSQVLRLQQWEGTGRADSTLQTVRKLRETLRIEILRWENGGAIRPEVARELNRLMARYPMRTRLEGRAGQLTTQRWFEVRQPEDLLAPLAQAAAELLTGVDRSRVRKCAKCVLHFLDTSKKGTRRWCSMRWCGNRLKVAAYAARQRRTRKSLNAAEEPLR